MSFKILVHKRFDKAFKKINLTDAQLCMAASEVMNGVFEADLGGGVIKKRLALEGGKSGGARSIIFFKQGTTLTYYHGWPKDGSKKGAKEIEDDELEGFREQAKFFHRSSAEDIQKLLVAGTVREVTC